jgi:hypothetical protein
MSPYRTILSAIIAASIFSVILLFTGCSVTYPHKHGNITLEFTPTDAMLERAGISRAVNDK